MTVLEPFQLKKIKKLPHSLSSEGAISLTVQDGVPILRASRSVQDRVHLLLDKATTGSLTQFEREELDRFEEIDDYLSYLNRLTRNAIQVHPK